MNNKVLLHGVVDTPLTMSLHEKQQIPPIFPKIPELLALEDIKEVVINCDKYFDQLPYSCTSNPIPLHVPSEKIFSTILQALMAVEQTIANMANGWVPAYSQLIAMNLPLDGGRRQDN